MKVNPAKIIMIAASLALSCAPKTIAGTGWLDPYMVLWNGTSDTVYTLLNTPIGTPPPISGSAVGSFNGANLGTFNRNNNYTLFMNTQISAWADGGDSYSNFSLLYRVYSGTPTPTFTAKAADSINNIGGNDFRGVVTGIDLSNLAVGSYTIEAYISRSHTWTGGGPYTTYLNRTGDTAGVVPTSNLFSASFTVVPEPSSASLMALGAAGLLALRRRRTA